MAQSIRWCRLIGAAAGVVLATVGALALTSPAQAQPLAEGTVFFSDLCDGTLVELRSGNDVAEYVWKVTAGGVTYLGEEDEQPPAGEATLVVVPSGAGTIEVDYAGSPAGWPQTHDWGGPPADFCGELGEVVITQPTCDEATGSIEFPAVPDGVDPDELEFFVFSQADLPVDDFDEVDSYAGGETVTLAPDTYVAWVYFSQIDNAVRLWELEIEAADCPPADGGDDDGAGGELPTTGSPIMLLGGGALLLLSVGGGLLLLTRRRVGLTS